ncbi:hypothetical protein EDD85DRAFT_1001322 [Armillaria nabsnona]|nr:hypothetical protein EDD85DRAFT_1001322 [Armillaria nabsnona]
MTTFPPELVEIIVYEAWHSDMPSYVRKRLMTACPSINRTWKAVYAPIASQDMYITNLAFLDYLCRIAQFQKSIIYHDFIPRLTRTITCFVDLRENENEETAKEAYRYVVALPNLLGFQALFPLVPYLSFKTVWVCIGEDIYLPPFRGSLIRPYRPPGIQLFSFAAASILASSLACISLSFSSVSSRDRIQWNFPSP